MPKITTEPVDALSIDLRNYRTVPQPNELAAYEAMVSISPDRFWALTESLIEDGFHPNENLIVYRDVKSAREYTVREGNRRLAALKLIHGLLKDKNGLIPEHISQKIAALPAKWKQENRAVPCVIYATTELKMVERIVALVHGKGDQASRENWTAVARARHNRDELKTPEPALDLLEAYLKQGKNLNALQRERWGGDYPVTVLDEALKRLAPRLGSANARDLGATYPADSKFRKVIEPIMHDIGLGNLATRDLRPEAGIDVLSATYGAPPLSKPAGGPAGAGGGGSTGKGGGQPVKGPAKRGSGPKAYASDDPRSVVQKLRRFNPHGVGREKVVTLRDEAIRIKIDRTPLAFCFVLRSMFEISGKAYIKDHIKSGGPTGLDKNGKSQQLKDLLNSIVHFMTNNLKDAEKCKQVHGARAELAKQDSILSVTSMNQLVHGPDYVVVSGDVCKTFSNIFPLLEELN